MRISDRSQLAEIAAESVSHAGMPKARVSHALAIIWTLFLVLFSLFFLKVSRRFRAAGGLDERRLGHIFQTTKVMRPPFP